MLTRNQILEAVNVGDIVISDFDESQLNPNSYDLRLSEVVLKYKNTVLNAAEDSPTLELSIGKNGLTLMPGELYLMATIESTYSKKYIPCIEGRSSVGRLGISVHSTAGFGDIGFNGTWTLEVSVVKPVTIYANMRICQIFFEETSGDHDIVSYSGKYNGQTKPRKSKIYKEVNEWLGFK